MQEAVITVTPNPSLDRVLSVAQLCPGELNRVQAVQQEVGGKGINVSKVLRVFGIMSKPMGFLGGNTGAEVHSWFESSGWKTAFTAVREATRINTKIRSGSSITEFNEPGPNVTGTEVEALLAAVAEAAPALRYVVLAGSLPPGCPTDFYARCVRTAENARAGVFTFLDTSGEALEQGLAARPTAVKPNLGELAELMGRKLLSLEDAAAALRALAGQGIRYPLCSLGAEGLLGWIDGRVIHVPALRVNVVQTVGCGDSAVAGFLAAHCRGKTGVDALLWAAAAGTAAAAAEGVGLQNLESFCRTVNTLQNRELTVF